MFEAHIHTLYTRAHCYSQDAGGVAGAAGVAAADTTALLASA